MGVYHNTAAATDWWIENDPDSGLAKIDTYSVGGVGDIFLFLGKTTDDVVKSYHHIIGKPVLTPLWALGWHQCKFGYENTQQLMDSVK